MAPAGGPMAMRISDPQNQDVRVLHNAASVVWSYRRKHDQGWGGVHIIMR